MMPMNVLKLIPSVAISGTNATIELETFVMLDRCHNVGMCTSYKRDAT